MDWLSMAANGAGLTGSICLVIPFFREDGLRRLHDTLKQAPARDGGAGIAFEAAETDTQTQRAQWSPLNYRLMVAGIALVGLSYLIAGVGSIIGEPQAQ